MPRTIKTRTVRGSTGTMYTVTIGKNYADCHCTCMAFRYSLDRHERGCKHIRAARQGRRTVNA